MTRKNKYNARQTTVDGVTFDSAKEARRWQELRLLERAGAITGLQRQFAVTLAPSVLLKGETRRKPALKAVIDFAYEVDGVAVFEDSKGFENDVSRMKRHLLKANHGIDLVLS